MTCSLFQFQKINFLGIFYLIFREIEPKKLLQICYANMKNIYLKNTINLWNLTFFPKAKIKKIFIFFFCKNKVKNIPY